MAATTPDNGIPPIPVPPPAVPAIAPAASDAPDAVRPDPYAVPAPVSLDPAASQPNPYSAPASAGSYTNPIQPGPYVPAVAGPPQTLSIIAMIAGIVGVLGTFLGIGFVPSLAGVIMGHIAQKRQPWAKPFWLTALITGYVGVGISLIIGAGLLVIFLIAITNSSN